MFFARISATATKVEKKIPRIVCTSSTFLFRSVKYETFNFVKKRRLKYHSPQKKPAKLLYVYATYTNTIILLSNSKPEELL